MEERENAYIRLDDTDVINRTKEIKAKVELINKATSQKSSGGRIIQSVDRAADVLETLAGQAGECSLNEISTLVSLNPSTCHHLLRTLMRREFIRQDPRTKMYSLGNKILELAQAKSRQIDLIRLATPTLRSLTGETGETSILSKIQGRELSVLANINSTQMVRVDGAAAGKSNAAHATATGKAILAWLPEGEIAAIIADKGMPKFTDKTTTSLANLLSELAMVRRHGYAIDDEEFQNQVVSISAAIRAHSGTVVASIGCSLPKERATQERLMEIKNHVKAAAKSLSKELGSS